MGSLEKLAGKVARGDTTAVTVWSRPDGEVVAVEEDSNGQPSDRWSGSVGAWQAALLAALSAKFVEGTLVIETPKLVSHGAIMEALETARKVEEATKRTVVVLGPGWRSMSREEAEHALRALAPVEHYPQLTDWVRSRPKGSCLLAVYADGENRPAIAQGDSDGKFLVFVKESEIDEVISIERYYCFNFVWLSKKVNPNCIGKIPRGVEVYREQ